jgi:hypothetical protein
MKLFYLFFFSILMTDLSRADVAINAPDRSNKLLRFLVEQEGLRDLALRNVIGLRCTRYLPRNRELACKMAVKEMIRKLDYNIIFSDKDSRNDGTWTPKSFVFIAFKQNLLTLLSSKKTNEYLNDLNQQLYKFISGEKQRSNIWEITKSHYKDDYRSSMILATLFQDTSIKKLHIAYLEQANIQGSAQFHKNKELLSRVIDNINFILDTSEDLYRDLFYPSEIQKDLNRNIYHFYVPFYLAQSLKNSGLDENDAFSAVLMLTLTYEFITSSNDYRYLFEDPYRMENTGAIKDIFGGYCGSNMGTRGLKFNKNFESIKASFQRSSEDGVLLLLRR